MAKLDLDFASFNEEDPSILADQLELYLLATTDLEELSRADIARLISIDDDPGPEEGEIIATDLDSRVDAVLQVFLSRYSRLSNHYPFACDGALLKLKVSPAANTAVVYAFLLACSNLTLLADYSGKKHVLTGMFEKLVCSAVEALLPPDSVVRQFGPGTDDRSNHFGTNLNKAIKQLALDCCYGVNRELLEPEDESKTAENGACGDCGLDVVGLWKFPDIQPGNLVLFCQCATGKNWHNKFCETRQILTYLQCYSPPIQIVSIPYDFRDNDGVWISHRYLSEGILVDRFRLCHLLAKAAALPELPIFSSTD